MKCLKHLFINRRKLLCGLRLLLKISHDWWVTASVNLYVKCKVLVFINIEISSLIGDLLVNHKDYMALEQLFENINLYQIFMTTGLINTGMRACFWILISYHTQRIFRCQQVITASGKCKTIGTFDIICVTYSLLFISICIAVMVGVFLCVLKN